MPGQISVGEPGPDGNPRPVYFLVHVPKCAGGTIERYLSANLQHERYVELVNAPKIQRIFTRPHYSARISNLKGEKVDVVTNHPLASSLRQRFADRPIRESVLLRDPLGQLMSQYNQKFHGRRGRKYGMPRFETWVRTKPANPISTFLLYRYFEFPMWKILLMSDQDRLDFLIDKLSRFWFVGDYRHCDTLLEELAKNLGLPKKTRNKGVRSKSQRIANINSIAPWVEEMVRNESAVDCALHEQFRDRLWGPEKIRESVDLPQRNLVRRLAREAARSRYMAQGVIEPRREVEAGSH